MQTERHKIVYLSFISTDLPLWNIIEAKASLYQKEKDKFHLLLNQQNLPHSLESETQGARTEASSILRLEKQCDSDDEVKDDSILSSNCQKSLLWLEISPYRVMLTMQSNSRFSYHHFWERGVYGISRYWLNGDTSEPSSSFRLRNYTRHLKLDCNPVPTSLQVQYELWSANLKLGSYVLHLDIN